MEILPYEPTMSSELASAYNNVICGVPHCYSVRVEDFVSAVAPLVEGGKSHARLHSEAAFVAKEGPSILGFIHLAVERPEEANEAEQGMIRFFWYERGHRAAGQALLVAGEEYLRQRDIGRVTAFPQDYRYRFYYLAHAYLSDHLDQVHALLGFNGYQRVAGEVFLDWPSYEPIVPSPADVSADISLGWVEGRGTRPGLKVQAHLGQIKGEKEMGVCECVSGGEFSHADDAQDWLHTVWLGVSEEVQGKGLGRYLLQRALQEMHTVGYRHAAISTSWQNFRAFLFYSNYGYRVVDWTYALSRGLECNSP